MSDDFSRYTDYETYDWSEWGRYQHDGGIEYREASGGLNELGTVIDRGGGYSDPTASAGWRAAVELESVEMTQTVWVGLPRRHRHVMWLRYAEGRPAHWDAIAEQIGRSTRQVRRMHRSAIDERMKVATGINKARAEARIRLKEWWRGVQARKLTYEQTKG